MNTVDIHATLSPKERPIWSALGSHVWGHMAVRVVILAVLVSLIFLLTRWRPMFWVLIPLGILGQMQSEYLIHRFIFHLTPPRGQCWFNVLYLCHYGHHDFPTKPGLFLYPSGLPCWFALPMLLAGQFLYTLIFTLLGFADVFAMAFAVGLVGCHSSVNNEISRGTIGLGFVVNARLYGFSKIAAA